ncbi:hypothetical protein ANCCAN_19684, partial [Ancylostoma caninum]
LFSIEVPESNCRVICDEPKTTTEATISSDISELRSSARRELMNGLLMLFIVFLIIMIKKLVNFVTEQRGRQQ